MKKTISLILSGCLLLSNLAPIAVVPKKQPVVTANESAEILDYILDTELVIDDPEPTIVAHDVETVTAREFEEEIEPEPETVEEEEADDGEVWTEELELLAQLVQAEAGNQGLKGMRYVVDVVLNRVDDDRFPDSIHDVIFQKRQFSPVANGALKKAAGNVSTDAYQAVRLELDARLNYGILYFNSGKKCLNGKNPFKYKDHWFAY